MVIREKELRINNFITLDSRAEQRDSEISEFEESLIKKYLQDLFPNIKIS